MLELLENFTAAGVDQEIRRGRFSIAGGVATNDDLVAISRRITNLRTVEKVTRLAGRAILAR